MIVNGLAVVGVVTLSAIALIVAYFALGVGLVLLDVFLHRLMHYIWITFGGKADPDTGEYKPPRPPWDRVRYEVGRIKYYVQRIQQKMGYGISADRGVTVNGLDALYDQREEHYE